MSPRTFITEEEIDKALNYLRDNADAAAKARAERLYLEEFRDHLLALIMKENDGPVAAQKRDAQADARYLAHLQGYRAAVHIDEKYRFRLDAVKAKIEAWRTQSSNERAGKL